MANRYRSIQLSTDVDRMLHDEENVLEMADMAGQKQSSVEKAESLIELLCKALPDDIASCSQLERQIDRLAQIIHDIQYAVGEQAQALLKNVTGEVEADSRSGLLDNNMKARQQVMIAEFNTQAQEISEAVLRTSSNAAHKATELHSLAKKLSLQTNESNVSGNVDSRLSIKPWTACAGGGGAVLILLNDIYHGIRRLAAGSWEAKVDRVVWVAPKTFERATHKYWVEEEHLAELMLACVKHVPLLVYGK